MKVAIKIALVAVLTAVIATPSLAQTRDRQSGGTQQAHPSRWINPPPRHIGNPPPPRRWTAPPHRDRWTRVDPPRRWVDPRRHDRRRYVTRPVYPVPLVFFGGGPSGQPYYEPRYSGDEPGYGGYASNGGQYLHQQQGFRSESGFRFEKRDVRRERLVVTHQRQLVMPVIPEGTAADVAEYHRLYQN